MCTDGAVGQRFSTQRGEDLRKVGVPQTPQLLDTQKYMVPYFQPLALTCISRMCPLSFLVACLAT